MADTDTRTFEALRAPELFTKHLNKYIYAVLLCAKDAILADKTGSYHKPTHDLAAFETKHQHDNPLPKDAEPNKYMYKKVETTTDEMTDEQVTTIKDIPVKKFANVNNADFRGTLEFFLVHLAKEFAYFYDTTSAKPVSDATFEKVMAETVEKHFQGSVTRFILTIGTVAHVDKLLTANIDVPITKLATEMEKEFGSGGGDRASAKVGALCKGYLSFVKVLCIFLANSLVECKSAFRLDGILATLRQLNLIQKMDKGACLNNAIFDELKQHIIERKSSGDEGEDDDLADAFGDAKPKAPKVKKAAAKKGKKAAAKKGAGKASAKKTAAKKAAAVNAPPPADETFDDDAIDNDDIGDEL
jgi:hypothetical protein